ncbi:hypothetical protein WP3W18E01_28690 [Raoultella ornithinolytica]|nr:hypothetical protein HMPREF9690_01992 [Raoultella ornithinolytica 10-5246]CAE6353230.1 hypothetical protein AI2711V1_2813 [Raoultella ornithinolytica]CAH3550471.1 hypothetical protein AI2711V1_2813 [Raoultella ornithinolytica]SBL28553.1 Uncharacterised protein [Raoultella ornithinolytica]STR71388.1 Uncharacterised protein [Raoultella ornithinolytica]
MKELLPEAHFCVRNMLNCGGCHSGTNECHREKSANVSRVVD